MAFSFSGGTVNVSGNVSAVSSHKTIKVLQGNTSSAGSTIGTVPANKTWTIVYARVSAYGSTGAANLVIGGSITIATWLFCYMGATTNNEISNEYFANYETGLQLVAGDTIGEKNATSQNGRYCVFYIEDSV